MVSGEKYFDAHINMYKHAEPTPLINAAGMALLQIIKILGTFFLGPRCSLGGPD